MKQTNACSSTSPLPASLANAVSISSQGDSNLNFAEYQTAASEITARSNNKSRQALLDILEETFAILEDSECLFWDDIDTQGLENKNGQDKPQ